MDIVAISSEFGDHIETNEELLLKLGAECPDEVRSEVSRLLNKSGAEQRRVRRPGQSPLEYLSRSFVGLDADPQRISMVINCSITRGVIEPAQAALFCEHLALSRAQAFDVTEACNGFIRGLQIGHALLSTDLVEGDILLVCHEFFDGESSPSRVSYDCASVESLSTLFAGMTFGSVSCCVLLRKSANRDWSFRWGADNSIAARCTVALPNYQEHVPLKDYHRERESRIGEWGFFSDHRTLGRTIRPFREALNEDPIHLDRLHRANPTRRP